MARRKYVVGNWKMNGLTAALGEAQAIFDAAKAHPAVDVALCPPFTLIGPMLAAAPGAAVGGQDCHSAVSGAYTGSVAAAMLADIGATLAIVGHSERREGFGESDADVKAKAEAALAAGLSVILCVGEPREVRESGGAIDYVLGRSRDRCRRTSMRRGLPSLTSRSGRSGPGWCRRLTMWRRCTARSVPSLANSRVAVLRARCAFSTAVR